MHAHRLNNIVRTDPVDDDKIKAVLKNLGSAFACDADMNRATEEAIADAANLILDLRAECDNQATKIVDLEEKAEAIPEMVAALTQVLKDDREFRCCSSATLEHIETVLKKVTK